MPNKNINENLFLNVETGNLTYYFEPKKEAQELFENNKSGEIIRALTWIQPYATLMLHGKIETRTYSTNVRGKVLICAGQKPYNTNVVWNISGTRQMLRIQKLIGQKEELRGMAMAIGELVDCYKMPNSSLAEDQCFVQYHTDRYCWIFANVQEIEPFPWKGKQGWSILTPEQIAKIKIK